MAAKNAGRGVAKQEHETTAPIDPDIRSSKLNQLLAPAGKPEKIWRQEVPCHGAKTCQPDGPAQPLAGRIASRLDFPGATITPHDRGQADDEK